MACKIIWSLQARDDLREIVSFIADDDPAVAESFGIRLISKVDVLANFPLDGSRRSRGKRREHPGNHFPAVSDYLSSAARATGGGCSPHLARCAWWAGNSNAAGGLIFTPSPSHLPNDGSGATPVLLRRNVQANEAGKIACEQAVTDQGHRRPGFAAFQDLHLTKQVEAGGCGFDQT